MPRDVFFERLTVFHRPLVAWLLTRGARVVVFDFSQGLILKWRPWFRRLVERGVVERVYIEPGSPADAQALEATEWLFPRASQHPLTRALEGLYGAEDTRTVLKKALLESVFTYLYLRQYLAHRVPQEAAGGATVLVPEMFWYWHRALAGWREDLLPPLPRIQTPGWVRAWAASLRLGIGLWLRVAAVLGGWVHLACLTVGRRCQGPGTPPRRYDHVYAVDQPFQVKFTGPRRFDFLLDGRDLTRENTAFLAHPTGEGPWVEEAQRLGYQVLRHRDFTSAGRPWRHLRTPSAMLDTGSVRRLLGAFASWYPAPRWMVEAAVRGLMVCLTKSALLERVAGANYIYMNQDHVSQQWLNALIRRRGGRTWNFAFAIGSGHLYGNPEQPGSCQRRLAYQVPDCFVGASRQLVGQHQRQRQAVRTYHVVGNIWSELIRTAVMTTDLQALRREWFGPAAQQPGTKVTAWFDTTFMEEETSASTYREGIAWYDDLLRLLGEDERLFAVVKPSKDEGYFVGPRAELAQSLGPALMERWARLKAHPRVFFAGHGADPTPIIAASDLTVTFCFSSPTAEALGARKRAIWYEPGERWRSTLYGGEPLLVAHGYEELRLRVRRLLYEITDDEYERFLDETVRGLVEEHLDGKGLSRFRRLLVDAVQTNGSQAR